MYKYYVVPLQLHDRMLTELCYILKIFFNYGIISYISIVSLLDISHWCYNIYESNIQFKYFI